MTDNALTRVARLFNQCRVDPFLQDQINDTLLPLGLTFGQFTDLLAEARYAEALAEMGTPHRAPVTIEGRRVIVRLAAIGFDAESIAVLLDGVVEAEDIQSFLAQRRLHMDETEVVSFHAQGFTAVEIAKKIGGNRQTVEKALRRAGLDPNVHHRRIPAELRQQVIKLKNEGKHQGEIREATGLDASQIKNVLRAARKTGQVREQGMVNA